MKPNSDSHEKLLLLVGFSTLLKTSYRQDEMKIWNEFLFLVINNKMATERIKPHDKPGDKFKPVLLKYKSRVFIRQSGDCTA
ncbi:MAG TPA: hypothetical protein P5320_08970 [Bacteroidales bacterium]|nr:hypothetical protein [Bacteroidales bacterium]HPP92645.1 hypothetical protein [Bacteroidales bacterium]HQK71905.1 hypothetical protein [Bacteroidales bacterium]HRR16845.1 hypothetical protein [Bacteroidales bacterium]